MIDRALLLRGLIAGLAVASGAHAPMARAEIVDTDAIAAEEKPAQTQAEQDRAKVRSFIESATVKDKLKAMGVGGAFIDDRLAALSPQEIHLLAQRIDAMPAGGHFTDSQLIILLLACILVAILV